jgi:hypothetical protein
MRSVNEGEGRCGKIGYPVLVRSQFQFSAEGRWRLWSDEDQLNYYMANVVGGLDDHVDAPILVDKFLDAAIEVDGIV